MPVSRPHPILIMLLEIESGTGCLSPEGRVIGFDEHTEC